MRLGTHRMRHETRTSSVTPNSVLLLLFAPLLTAVTVLSPRLRPAMFKTKASFGQLASYTVRRTYFSRPSRPSPLLAAPNSQLRLTRAPQNTSIHAHTHTQLHPPPPSRTTMAAPKTAWLITGASSGFGQSLGLVALEAGHKVIGATRDVAKAQAANPDFTAKGGIWLQLDPAHPDSFDQFAKAQEEYDIDVLVNNAGYAFIGGVEDTTSVLASEKQCLSPANRLSPVRRRSATRWRSISGDLCAPFAPSCRPCGRKVVARLSSSAAGLGKSNKTLRAVLARP